jgi:hypothetical protein
MFNNIKKAILSKRIKKSVRPAVVALDTGLFVYLKVFNSLLEASRLLITEAAPVIEKHSESIAEAALILEPLIKELKETKISAHIENVQNVVENLENTDEIKDSIEKITNSIDEINQIMKEI